MSDVAGWRRGEERGGEGRDGGASGEGVRGKREGGRGKQTGYLLLSTVHTVFTLIWCPISLLSLCKDTIIAC